MCDFRHVDTGLPLIFPQSKARDPGIGSRPQTRPSPESCRVPWPVILELCPVWNCGLEFSACSRACSLLCVFLVVCVYSRVCVCCSCCRVFRAGALTVFLALGFIGLRRLWVHSLIPLVFFHAFSHNPLVSLAFRLWVWRFFGDFFSHIWW